MNAPLLAVEGLSVTFRMDRKELRAVRDISLSVSPGEVVGLVGESGSGKSVAMMSVMRLVDPAVADLVADRLELDGRDISSMDRRELEDLRGKLVAYIFQDPLTALNPVLSVGRQITEVLRRHRKVPRGRARTQALDLMRAVGIPGPELRIDQHPHQFSGGMRQRVMIAMALAGGPRLLIADEPTTALDVTLQAEIVNLIRGIQRDENMALIWVTHDLALLARLAHRVVVMYAGRIVEDAPAERLYEKPLHPYTAGLLASTSRMDRSFRDQEPIPGSPPNPFDDVQACSFAPRCARATAKCRAVVPPLEMRDDGRRIACFHPLDQVRR